MEIGARLKEAREAKNLSLEDLQKITKIQTRYLQAIEKGNFSVMPGNFYIRAFIKEYATAVDLDPEQLMEEYKSELPTTSEESSIQYTRVQRSRKDTTPSNSPTIFSFLPTIIVVLLIIGIIFMVWSFRQGAFSDNNDQSEPTEDSGGGDQVQLPPDNENTDADSADDNGAEEKETNSGGEEEEEESQSDPDEPVLNLVEHENAETTYELVNPGNELKLVLSTDNKNWLEVENGKEKSFYYGTFLNDASPLELDMTGEEQIYLRFGEPASLTITINDVPLELPEDINASEVQEVWIDVINDTE